MSDKTLRVVDIGLGAIDKHTAESLTFLDIPEWRRGSVGVHDSDVLRLHLRLQKCFAHTFGLTHWIRQHVITRIRVDAIAGNLPVNLRASRKRIVQSFEG